MQKPNDSRVDCAWEANIDGQKSADLSSHEFSVEKRMVEYNNAARYLLPNDSSFFPLYFDINFAQSSKC